jgi:hypothetical protein
MQQNMAKKLYDLKQIEMDQRAMDLARAEEECRRAINSAVKDYNDALVGNVDRNKKIYPKRFRFLIFFLFRNESKSKNDK